MSGAEQEVTPEDAGTSTCCPDLFVPETRGMWGHLLRVKGMGEEENTAFPHCSGFLECTHSLQIKMHLLPF